MKSIGTRLHLRQLTKAGVKPFDLLHAGVVDLSGGELLEPFVNDPALRPFRDLAETDAGLDRVLELRLRAFE